MPASAFPFRRTLAATLVALSLGAGGLRAEASEHAAPAAEHAAPAGEAKAEPKAEAAAASQAAAGGKAAAAPAKARRVGGGEPDLRDPMDVIRDRLAEKLGTIKAPPEAGNLDTVRVVAKETTGTIELSVHPSGAVKRSSAGHGKPAAAAGHADAPHPIHWDYDGDNGPAAWAHLKPEFAACASGSRQSPIDIRDGIRVQLDPVMFDYKPSGFRVADNGHTIQVNVGPGNSIEVMGRRYDLVQFHFHRPSEERVNGRQFDMVAHLVHKDIDGRLAVVAVLLDRGSAHPLIQNIWNNLPLEKGDEVAAKGAIDLNALLPAERSYFTYMGSLTTPPCSEGVLWMVMKNPVALSPDQINIFARLYPMNARPIQSASGRLIKESN